MSNVPFQAHSLTSIEAARSMKPRTGTIRDEIYRALLRAGRKGMTDEEICDALKLQGSTERPRRIELYDEGRITDSGNTRLTKSGRKAAVWVVIEYASTFI